MLDILGTTSSVESNSTTNKYTYPLNLLGIEKLSIKSEKLAV